MADVAFKDLAKRVGRSRSESREANAAAVRSMLMRFLAWDEPETAPEVFFPTASVATIGTHSVSLSPSLRYNRADGYLIRHVWTESDFSLRRPYARLAAAGYLVHSEAAVGVGLVRQVEFWHVRSGKAAAWRARDLRTLVPSLINVLDDVARSLQGLGDPGQAA